MIVRVPLTTTGPLTEAILVARPNQMLVEARINGRLVRVQLHDRGRLPEGLTPGTRLLLAPREEAGRKTALEVVGVYCGDELVALDPHLAQRLVVAALAQGALPQFARYTRMQREAMIGSHRFEFRLGEGLHTCLLEVKAATRVVGGVAYLPDAPNERERKHLELLGQMARGGQRCAVLFIIQCSAARALVPDEELDPAFARALRLALAAGVEVYAYLCPLSPEGVTLGTPVAVYTALSAIPRSKWKE
ncbi:MAG: DNA/RNA nuclease SfsA [Candidatus Viridilinea halotolerans]|uniref:DNA/RNA nuclease SfsA n=1 Tax=Candidatus Viridilinea halotolerans TaxID=2491704 RepID=A0A426U4D0_9CHLR|nr:MAG: DNA/RNA nuclease SfsA [Candidatus Viridilinea halotolerans]